MAANPRRGREVYHSSGNKWKVYEGGHGVLGEPRHRCGTHTHGEAETHLTPSAVLFPCLGSVLEIVVAVIAAAALMTGQ